MAKGQRKQKQETINKTHFEGMCHVQCTQSEMCSILGVSEDTLYRWCQETYGTNFADAYKKFSEGGKMSLRRMQWKKAEAGSDTMLVWLGKNILGQTDNKEIEHNFGKVDDSFIDAINGISDKIWSKDDNN